MYEKEKQAIIAERTEALSHTDVCTEIQAIMKAFSKLLRQYDKIATRDNNVNVFPVNLPAAILTPPHPFACKEPQPQDEVPQSTSSQPSP